MCMNTYLDFSHSPFLTLALRALKAEIGLGVVLSGPSSLIELNSKRSLIIIWQTITQRLIVSVIICSYTPQHTFCIILHMSSLSPHTAAAIYLPAVLQLPTSCRLPYWLSLWKAVREYWKSWPQKCGDAEAFTSLPNFLVQQES